MPYFPTLWAILWTRHEKGNLCIRSSVLFWNWWISWRATIPSQYLQDLFNNPALRNSFLGALLPTISWSFFQAGSSPGDVDGPHWWPSQPTVSSGMTLETSPPTQVSSPPPSFAPPHLVLGDLFSCRCYRFCRVWRFCRCWRFCMCCVDLHQCSNLLDLTPYPFGSHLCSCHTGKKTN